MQMLSDPLIVLQEVKLLSGIEFYAYLSIQS